MLRKLLVAGLITLTKPFGVVVQAQLATCGLSKEELLQVAKDDPELYRLLRGQGAMTAPDSTGDQQGKEGREVTGAGPVVEI